MSGLAAQEAQIAEWLGTQKEAMLALLAELVNIDSGSYDKAGVDAVGRRLVAFFQENGLVTATEPNETYGEAIHVRLDDARPNERPIVLMGHRDTVFAKGEAGRRPFHIEGARAYGPGVADMKGGLVVNAFVLAAFRRCRRPRHPTPADRPRSPGPGAGRSLRHDPGQRSEPDRSPATRRAAAPPARGHGQRRAGDQVRLIASAIAPMRPLPNGCRVPRGRLGAIVLCTIAPYGYASRTWCTSTMLPSGS